MPFGGGQPLAGRLYPLEYLTEALQSVGGKIEGSWLPNPHPNPGGACVWTSRRRLGASFLPTRAPCGRVGHKVTKGETRCRWSARWRALWLPADGASARAAAGNRRHRRQLRRRVVWAGQQVVELAEEERARRRLVQACWQRPPSGAVGSNACCGAECEHWPCHTRSLSRP